MNRDEARKLVGGYATGSLTDSERHALFAAALDDQELFDELAEEQSLKELLDGPGVRDRLLAGLAPRPEKRRWNWGWAGAVSVLAGSAALAVLWLNLPKPPETIQITERVELPSPRKAPGPPTFDERGSATPALAAPAQAASVGAIKDVARSQPESEAKPAAKGPSAVAAAGSIATRSRSDVGQRDATSVSATAEAPVLKAAAPPLPQLAPSAFAPLVAPQAQKAKDAPATAPVPTVAEQSQVQPAPPPELQKDTGALVRNGFAGVGGGGRGGGRGGGAVGGLVQQQTFGFRYQVNETFLQVTPTSVGWLTVLNGDAVLFSNRMVPSAVPLAVPVPAEAKELTIQFAAQAGPVSVTPQRRTTLAGVVAADSQVAIIIPARP